MDSFFTRYKNSLVLIAVLLVQTIGLAIQVPHRADSAGADGRSVLLLRYWAVSTITPFERLFHGTGWLIRNGWSNYIDLRHTHAQNLALQQQLGQLRIQAGGHRRGRHPGPSPAGAARLPAALRRRHCRRAGHRHHAAASSPASSISTKAKPTASARTRPSSPPTASWARPATSSPHTAQVLLINDQSSGAGVLVASSRIRGILRGTANGRIVINNLTADSRIKPGEPVLTSGGDQVYPRGLPVGTVESIAPDPDHQPYTLIQLRPAANLFQLEERCWSSPEPRPSSHRRSSKTLSPEPPPPQPAAQAAAAHAAELKAIEDAKSAADIVADRLPSLHDDANPADPNAKPGTPGATSRSGRQGSAPSASVAPGPLQPRLHSSAADLTPGAPHTHETPPPPKIPELRSSTCRQAAHTTFHES